MRVCLLAAFVFPLGFSSGAPLSSLATSRLANHLGSENKPCPNPYQLPVLFQGQEKRQTTGLSGGTGRPRTGCQNSKAVGPSDKGCSPMYSFISDKRAAQIPALQIPSQHAEQETLGR